MIGTRTARIAALTAAFVLGAALTAATLLSTGTSNGLHTGRHPAALTDRTPVLLRSAEQGTAAPRTTPPPTFPAPAATSDRPAAATTVEHS